MYRIWHVPFGQDMQKAMFGFGHVTRKLQIARHNNGSSCLSIGAVDKCDIGWVQFQVGMDGVTHFEYS